jgi:hypothetical protein
MRFYMRGFGMTTGRMRRFWGPDIEREDNRRRGEEWKRPRYARERMSLDVPPAAGR